MGRDERLTAKTIAQLPRAVEIPATPAPTDTDRTTPTPELGHRSSDADLGDASASARRTNSAMLSVSGRRPPSIPASRSIRAGVAATAGGKASRALASVFRRRVKTAWTSPAKSGLVADRRVRRVKPQPDERRQHLRRRTERARRELQDRLDARRMADQDAEDAVLAAAGPGHQAVGDLALQHHGRVGERQRRRREARPA